MLLCVLNTGHFQAEGHSLTKSKYDIRVAVDTPGVDFEDHTVQGAFGASHCNGLDGRVGEMQWSVAVIMALQQHHVAKDQDEVPDRGGH